MKATSDRRSARTLIAAALTGALLTGIAVWAAMDARLSNAEDEIVAKEASSANGGQRSEAPGDAVSDDSAVLNGEDGRYFCFLEATTLTDGRITLTVDYARMLSGAEAAAAAAAEEESPPPNDYFIVNDNPQLRKFPVDPTAQVRLTTTEIGTNPYGYVTTLDEWYDMVTGVTPRMGHMRDVPYWITIEEGSIVAVEEQYLP